MKKVSVSNQSNSSHCSVALIATLVPEPTLEFQLSPIVDLRNETGEIYEYATIHYWCGEGLAHARRKLGLEGGISVEIRELFGTVTLGDEVGVSLAVASAIAESLGTGDIGSIFKNRDDWRATTSSQ